MLAPNECLKTYSALAVYWPLIIAVTIGMSLIPFAQILWSHICEYGVVGENDVGVAINA